MDGDIETVAVTVIAPIKSNDFVADEILRRSIFNLIAGNGKISLCWPRNYLELEIIGGDNSGLRIDRKPSE